jgi:streptogramin lyase
MIGGPDGNVWFTEVQLNKVVRVTPDGTITELVVPTGSSAPSAIAEGADGNLWFTEQTGNKIGRIDLASPAPTATATLPPTRFPQHPRSLRNPAPRRP